MPISSKLPPDLMLCCTIGENVNGPLLLARVQGYHQDVTRSRNCVPHRRPMPPLFVLLFAVLKVPEGEVIPATGSLPVRDAA